MNQWIMAFLLGVSHTCYATPSSGYMINEAPAVGRFSKTVGEDSVTPGSTTVTPGSTTTTPGTSAPFQSWFEESHSYFIPQSSSSSPAQNQRGR